MQSISTIMSCMRQKQWCSIPNSVTIVTPTLRELRWLSFTVRVG